MTRKVTPSATVIHIHRIVLLRWLAISAWCAIVSVTPEVSSSAVLMVGSGHGPMTENGSTVPAGDAVMPAPAVGQTALKSGHSSWCSRLPSMGKACARAQYRAPKKAAKNMTSLKMNQLMLQRNETSTRSLYRRPSLSPTAWLNHWYMITAHIARPNSTENLPQQAPLIHWPAPRMTKNIDSATIAGWRDGCGMK